MVYRLFEKQKYNQLNSITALEIVYLMCLLPLSIRNMGVMKQSQPSPLSPQVERRRHSFVHINSDRHIAHLGCITRCDLITGWSNKNLCTSKAFQILSLKNLQQRVFNRFTSMHKKEGGNHQLKVKREINEQKKALIATVGWVVFGWFAFIMYRLTAHQTALKGNQILAFLQGHQPVGSA